MINRYTLPEMGAIWSEKYKYKIWLQVELAVCDALAARGLIPLQDLEILKKKADFSVERIEEIEAVTRHDVVAFLTCVAEYVGPAARFVHFGMTSSDLLDTANAIRLKDSADILINDLESIIGVLKEKAHQYKMTPMIGRTHGIHAEPITFGMKLALWYREMIRNQARMEQAKMAVSVGKISGAVGTYAHLAPEIEKEVCRAFGLVPARISTQVIQRDRYADLLSAIAITGSTIEKIALEIRHLQRSEVLEAEEYFARGQKGSSAMPHKRNPIVCENLCGLARVLRSNLMAGLENNALWHERDISHSSVERVILPDSTVLLNYMLDKTKTLVEKLVVYPQNMASNLERYGDLVFSEGILLKLVEKGLTREKAYELVQRNAMEAWQGKRGFKALLLADQDVTAYLSQGEIDELCSLKTSLKHVDFIFERVFGS
jgi:adenylosuccinate lyase